MVEAVDHRRHERPRKVVGLENKDSAHSSSMFNDCMVSTSWMAGGTKLWCSEGQHSLKRHTRIRMKSLCFCCCWEDGPSHPRNKYATPGKLQSLSIESGEQSRFSIPVKITVSILFSFLVQSVPYEGNDRASYLRTINDDFHPFSQSCLHCILVRCKARVRTAAWRICNVR